MARSVRARRQVMAMNLGRLLQEDASRIERRLLWSGGPREPKSLLRIASEVSEAMSYLHSCDVLCVAAEASEPCRRRSTEGGAQRGEAGYRG